MGVPYYILAIIPVAVSAAESVTMTNTGRQLMLRGGGGNNYLTTNTYIHYDSNNHNIRSKPVLRQLFSMNKQKEHGTINSHETTNSNESFTSNSHDNEYYYYYSNADFYYHYFMDDDVNEKVLITKRNDNNENDGVDMNVVERVIEDNTNVENKEEEEETFEEEEEEEETSEEEEEEEYQMFEDFLINKNDESYNNKVHMPQVASSVLNDFKTKRVYSNLRTVDEVFQMIVQADDADDESSSDDVIWFWHVPKAAGTTYKDMLDLCYHKIRAKNVIDPPSTDIVKVGSKEQYTYVNLSTNTLEDIQLAKQLNLLDSGNSQPQPEVVVSGRFQLMASELFDSSEKSSRMGRCITLLRHPIERDISMFYYLATATWEPTYNPEYLNMTLMDYSLSRNKHANNWYIRTILGKPEEILSEKDVAEAVTILRTHCLVGFVDPTMDKCILSNSVKRFEHYLGFTAGEGEGDNQQEQCVEEHVFGGLNIHHESIILNTSTTVKSQEQRRNDKEEQQQEGQQPQQEELCPPLSYQKIFEEKFPRPMEDTEEWNILLEYHKWDMLLWEETKHIYLEQQRKFQQVVSKQNNVNK